MYTHTYIYIYIYIYIYKCINDIKSITSKEKIRYTTKEN